jgi:hypothetical protein
LRDATYTAGLRKAGTPEEWAIAAKNLVGGKNRSSDRIVAALRDLVG